MKTPILSVVIPAFQEETRLGATLDAVFAYLRTQSYAAEVIVVDDGSKDATAAVAGRFLGRDIPLAIQRHVRNRGKGAAVQTGMLQAQGVYALLADADNSTPFDECAKLLAALEQGCDIAIGSRYVAGSAVEQRQPVIRRLMSRAGNLLFRVVLGLPFHDTRCGFKMFSRAARTTVFPLQRLERFGFDTEILVIAREHKLRVCEIPVRWRDRSRSTIQPIRDSLRSLKEIAQIVQHRAAGDYRPHHHGTQTDI